MRDPDDVRTQAVVEPDSVAAEEGWRYGRKIGTRWLMVRRLDETPFVAFGTWLMPARFEVSVEDGERLPYVTNLLFSVSEDRVTCEALAVMPLSRWRGHLPNLLKDERNDITTAGLRQIPASTLIQEAILVAVHEERPEGPQPAALEDWAAFYATQKSPPRRRPGDQLGDEHYKRVADLYRKALGHGRPPTKAVEGSFHVSPSTAARWVHTARRRGHLGATSRGVAGERASTIHQTDQHTQSKDDD